MSFLLALQVSAQLSSDSNSPLSGSGLQKGEHQIGISNNLAKEFNLTYRYAVNDDLLLRISLDRLSIGLGNFGGNDDDDDDDRDRGNYSFGFGTSIGLEKHIPTGKRWSAYYGAELGLGFGSASTHSSYRYTNLLGLAGIKLNVNQRFSLFGEMKYGLQWNTTNSNNNRRSFNFSAGGGFGIGALVRIGKRG